MIKSYYACGSPFDIMVSHGAEYADAYTSVWRVTDAIKKYEKLKIKFPSHEEHKLIAHGFLKSRHWI